MNRVLFFLFLVLCNSLGSRIFAQVLKIQAPDTVLQKQIRKETMNLKILFLFQTSASFLQLGVACKSFF